MSTCCRILRMVFMNEASFYRYVSFHITKLCSWHTEMCTIHTVKCIFNRIVTCYDNPSLNVNLPFFCSKSIYTLCMVHVQLFIASLRRIFAIIGKQCKMCEFLSIIVAVIIFLLLQMVLFRKTCEMHCKSYCSHLQVFQYRS